MRTKGLCIAALLLGLATVGYSQGASVPKDSTEMPTLALLKAQVLQNSANTSSSVHVPSEHRALFCRFDDKLDQKRIPLRMRLGSVDEVNRMEAKPGFRAGQVPQ